MKWLPIDPSNLPEGEVLGANFKPETYNYTQKILGFLYSNGIEDNSIICEAETGVCVQNCTHYIDIHSFDLIINSESSSNWIVFDTGCKIGDKNQNIEFNNVSHPKDGRA